MDKKIGAIGAIRFYMKTIRFNEMLLAKYKLDNISRYVLKKAIKDAEEKIEILQDKITNGEVD